MKQTGRGEQKRIQGSMLGHLVKEVRVGGVGQKPSRARHCKAGWGVQILS